MTLKVDPVKVRLHTPFLYASLYPNTIRLFISLVPHMIDTGYVPLLKRGVTSLDHLDKGYAKAVCTSKSDGNNLLDFYPISLGLQAVIMPWLILLGVCQLFLLLVLFFWVVAYVCATVLRVYASVTLVL